jgi:hypothetical protein
VESTHEWLAAELLSRDPVRARSAMVSHLMRDPVVLDLRKSLFHV